MATSVQGRTLQRLVELMGSRTRLAKALGVAEQELGRWITDTAKVPAPLFLKAVDLLLEETAGEGDDGQSSDGASPRDCAAEPSGTWYSD